MYIYICIASVYVNNFLVVTGHGFCSQITVNRCEQFMAIKTWNRSFIVFKCLEHFRTQVQAVLKLRQRCVHALCLGSQVQLYVPARSVRNELKDGAPRTDTFAVFCILSCGSPFFYLRHMHILELHLGWISKPLCPVRSKCWRLVLFALFQARLLC